MIQIIDIRKHNEYCILGMLQGRDMKKSIIKRPIKTTKLDQHSAAKLEEGVQEILRGIQNVER